MQMLDYWTKDATKTKQKKKKSNWVNIVGMGQTMKGCWKAVWKAGEWVIMRGGKVCSNETTDAATRARNRREKWLTRQNRPGSKNYK